MSRVTFGRWTLECDPEATRRAYQALAQGAPERCGCDPCKNFAAQRQSVYPEAVRTLLGQLGIDPTHEAEIYHTARLPSGRHHYGGWFHFIGCIEQGADAHAPSGALVLEAVGERFLLGFSSRIALPAPSLAGRPLVQVEFAVELPWVISAPEPR